MRAADVTANALSRRREPVDLVHCGVTYGEFTFIDIIFFKKRGPSLAAKHIGGILVKFGGDEITNNNERFRQYLSDAFGSDSRLVMLDVIAKTNHDIEPSKICNHAE